MKRVILFCALMFVCSCSFAEINEFKYFYIDIPEGWSVSSQDSMINIKADDDSGSLIIIADTVSSDSFEEVAMDLAAQFNASIVDLDSEDDYIFEFNEGKSQAILTGNQDEGFYMFIAGTGFVSEKESDDALIKILDSLEMK